MKPQAIFKNLLLLLLSLLFWSSSPLDDAAGKHQVLIREMKFEPKVLHVQKGDTIVFLNRDLVIHNVTEKNRLWASPTIQPKSSWTYIVKEDLEYFCTFHPMMKGSLKTEKK